MSKRKGLGRGLGQGYKNIVSKDPIVHSMSAKGVKQRQALYPQWRVIGSGVKPGFPNPFDISGTWEEKKLAGQNLYLRQEYDESGNPNRWFLAKKGESGEYINLSSGKGNYQKSGLIKEIARKAVDGVKWAVEWEKEHLPAQREWVKQEYESAKQKIKSGVDHLTHRHMTEKQKDAHDVRDELDHDDDGKPDIEFEDLEIANDDIRFELEDIDLDDSGVADAHEDGTFRLHEDEPFIPPPPKPPPTRQELFESVEFEVGEGVALSRKPKPPFLRRAKGFVVSKFEKTKRDIQSEVRRRELEKDFLQTLSDKRLKELAIKEGAKKESFMDFVLAREPGINKYEKELIKRETTKIELKKKLEFARKEAKAKKVQETDRKWYDIV